jgi:Fe-S-cluster containining protein
MGSLSATSEDVERWMEEGRVDILRFVSILGHNNAGLPFADLWIDERGVERSRCPFVRKVRGANRYLCSIYETRPQVCRDYVPWAPGTICEDVK